MTSSAVASGSRIDLTERGNSSRSPGSSSTSEAFSRSLAEAGSDCTDSGTVPVRDDNSTLSDVPLSLTPNPFNPYGRMITRPQADTPSATPSADPSAPAEPMQIFRDALAKVGIDASNLNAVERDFVVSSPAGSYEEHDIFVDYGGRQVAYDVGLMTEKPWLTALDVSRALSQSTKEGDA